MHRIWHRPALLGPLFWSLGKMGVLVPHNAVDIPTTLVVRPGQNAIDGVYHIWDRTFAFFEPVRFRTTIIYDRELDEVVDLVGPGNVLYLVWKARFHPPDKFTLDTHSCAFRIAGKKIWMPRWLWKLLLGTVTFSQRADAVRPELTHVELLIHYPVFGSIFGYEGSFQTVRTKKPPKPAECDDLANNRHG